MVRKQMIPHQGMCVRKTEPAVESRMRLGWSPGRAHEKPPGSWTCTSAFYDASWEEVSVHWGMGRREEEKSLRSECDLEGVEGSKVPLAVPGEVGS